MPTWMPVVNLVRFDLSRCRYMENRGRAQRHTVIGATGGIEPIDDLQDIASKMPIKSRRGKQSCCDQDFQIRKLFTW